MSLADELQKLQALREQGALTDAEFTAAKKRLIDGADEPRQAWWNAKSIEAPVSSLKGLRRSRTDRWIGGVCGGLAEAAGAPSWAWRILFVLTAFVHGLGILIYVLLWIFVPADLPRLSAPAGSPAPTPIKE